MRAIISVLVSLSVFLICNGIPFDPTGNEPIAPEDQKMHVFILMVPETSVQELKKTALNFQARQDEESSGIVSDTGTYVAQILRGVLGGDVRQIFAGSLSFIGESDVQTGVSTMLATVAPSIQTVFRSWINRVHTSLGFNTTTLRPAGVGNSTRTRPSYGVVVGRPVNSAQAGQLASQQQAKPSQSIISPLVIPGTNILEGDVLFDTTTVEPLPFIETAKGGDEDDSA